MSIVSNIVGRCHVGDSDLAVYKYFRSRMNNKFLKMLSIHDRRERVREVTTMALQEHHDNQKMFRNVMRGAG
jgi:hypothetical protein